MRARTMVAAVFVALALAAAPHAALADGPAASPPGRPAPVVLRAVDAPQRDAVLGAPRREIVVFVGGIWSRSDDGVFADLERRMRASGYDVLRFGDDPRFVYDTSGPIAANGERFRDQIRALSPRYDAIHVVTHSMGGNVVDSAFADGLGASDGVATYVALASPHSGSSLAAIAQTVVLAAGDARGDLSAILGRDLDGRAVRDLARPTSPPRVDGVARLDLREATDWTVGRDDMRDGAVASRTLGSLALDGHGAITADPAAMDIVSRLIAERRVPPDERSAVLIAASELEARHADALRRTALACLLLVGCVGATLLRKTRPARRGIELLWRRLQPLLPGRAACA